MLADTNTSTADLCSNLPALPHPSDSKSADPPAPTHTFTFKHSSATEAPKLTPVSCSYGPFRIWRVLGKGGFATAMGAQDIPSNRLLCLKVFRKDRLEYKSTQEVLLNELEVYKRLASSMPCPATRFIMGLELSFQTKDHVCFAIDLMTGDLHTRMARTPSYCFQNARRWTVQMALGINALHGIGIIHRDIKAANILIDVRENVRIADFGLCYIDKKEGPLDQQQKYTASAVGTTYCMAPEVLYNRHNLSSMKYGTPVDWWALGCVVYELVSRKHKALFATEDQISLYVSWRSSRGGTSELYPNFKFFTQGIADLVSGLLDPVPSSRYGFREVMYHRAFLLKCGTSEFSNAYSRALERKELPDTLPDFRCDQETHTAEVWHRLASWEKSRIPNVDWMKPAFFSSL